MQLEYGYGDRDEENCAFRAALQALWRQARIDAVTLVINTAHDIVLTPPVNAWRARQPAMRCSEARAEAHDPNFLSRELTRLALRWEKSLPARETPVQFDLAVVRHKRHEIDAQGHRFVLEMCASDRPAFVILA